MPRKRRRIKSVIKDTTRRNGIPPEMRVRSLYVLPRHWAKWDAAAQVAGIKRNTFICCVCNHMAEQILGERAQQKQIDIGNHTVTRIGAENADPRPESLPTRAESEAAIRDAWDVVQRAEGVAGIKCVDQP